MVKSPASSTGGLERATPLERFISLFHIPYYLGCLLISSIIGPPGAILLCYSKTQDIHLAISKTVWLFVGLEMPELQGIFSIFLIFSILFYCTYIIRFMRMRLISAKEKLIPILPDEATFQNAFKSVLSVRNPILLGAVIIITANLETQGNFAGFGTAPVDFIYFTLCLIVWSIIAGQFVWVYLSSILGLHNLGRSALKLKSHQEDNMLGVKPIGSLSLSLAITYLILFGAFVLLATLFQAGSPIFFILITTLILSGVLIFFLPLITTHKRMLEAKNRELIRIDQMLIKATETLNNNVKDGSEAHKTEINKTLKQLTTTITIDIQRHARAEVKEWPIWPIDTQIISRLGAMIISITCIILANMILRMIF